MNLGSFLNEYATNPTVFWSLLISAIFSLSIFGYFYNRLMDNLKGMAHEHTSLYVAIGVSVTLGFAALLSWKAALLLLIFFAADGSFMIVGEFIRTRQNVIEQEEERKRTPRRKRLPYAANGRIDDANMAANDANKLLGMAFKEKDPAVRALQLAQISHELHNVSRYLLELKTIQQIEE